MYKYWFEINTPIFDLEKLIKVVVLVEGSLNLERATFREQSLGNSIKDIQIVLEQEDLISKDKLNIILDLFNEEAIEKFDLVIEEQAFNSYVWKFNKRITKLSELKEIETHN